MYYVQFMIIKLYIYKKENQLCSNLKEKFCQKKNVIIYENVVWKNFVGLINFFLLKFYFCVYIEMKNVELMIIKLFGNWGNIFYLRSNEFFELI